MEQKISIVLPCYNAASTLNETLESINRQLLEEFELVIINDGSKDSTLQIIKSFPFRNGIKVNLISRENKGFLKSLAEGINVCEGDLIARIDSDDIWEKNHLSLIVPYFKDEKLVLVGSNATIINSKGEVLGKTSLPCTDKEIRRRFLNDNVFVHSSVVFRKEAYLKTTGYLCGNDEKAMHIADYNLWVELSAFGKVCNINECTLKYRYLDNSMSRTVNRKNNYEARLSVQKKAYSIYKMHFFYHLFCVTKTYMRIIQAYL